MTDSTKGNVVYCIFDRDIEDWDKSELIKIFHNPEGALQYIKESNNIDLFWEQWPVT